MPEAQKTTVNEPFKHCTCCSVVWPTRDDFLADPEVELIGYQAHFEDLKAGFLLFNHACHPTLALEVEEVQDLYHGPIFRERASGGPNCLGYCFHRSELRPCPSHCECTFVREILQVVRQWKKRDKVA